MSEGERVGTKTKVHINLDLIVAGIGKALKMKLRFVVKKLL